MTTFLTTAVYIYIYIYVDISYNVPQKLATTVCFNKVICWAMIFIKRFIIIGVMYFMYIWFLPKRHNSTQRFPKQM